MFPLSPLFLKFKRRDRKLTIKGTSPSLVRARKPFRIGNAAIGLALLCFVSGVYTYSIAAVKQDDFVSQVPAEAVRPISKWEESRANELSEAGGQVDLGSIQEVRDLCILGLKDEQGQGRENEADHQSDVEDLLPPLASRAGMRSIEDEERDLLATIGATKERDRNMEREVPQTSSPSALSSGIPHTSSSSSSSSPFSSTSPSNSASTLNSMTAPSHSWIPLRWRRLSDMEWVKKNGWADQSGNVIIWGAPNVDNIGRMGDRADIKGKRGL